jgi:hypothetical protein
LKSWKSPNYLVGESFDLSGTLLDDHEVEDGKIVVDDAASDRLSLSLTSSAGSVARLALGEKELNSTDRADTLFLLKISLPCCHSPCFMGKPCLSLPPVTRTTYPAHSGPR